MSLLKTNSVQIGQSATATQNFTLAVPSSPDGTIKLARGNNGATTQDVLAVDASGQITATITGSTITGSTITGSTITGSTIGGGSITRATAQNATGVATIDFTNIPSWAKRITIILNEVDSTASGDILLQLGDSGGIENTGYVSGSVRIVGNGGSDSSNSVAGFVYKSAGQAVAAIFTIVNISGNIWIAAQTGRGTSGSPNVQTIQGGGSKTLSNTLDRVRLTLTASDTFNGGTVNILYEG
jgi:hypothetical protein